MVLRRYSETYVGSNAPRTIPYMKVIKKADMPRRERARAIKTPHGVSFLGGVLTSTLSGCTAPDVEVGGAFDALG